MREIKFRGRILDKAQSGGPWVYCGLEGSDFLAIIDRDTIGQFTGLIDANGVDIYEGDVLKWAVNEVEPVGEVYFADGWFDLRHPARGSIGWDPLRGEVKVLGNIHQNPELMEVQP